MSAFGGVLQNGPGFSINAYLMGDFAIFDIERIAQTAPTFFLLQLFVRDFAGECLQGNSPGLFDSNLGIARQILAGVGEGIKGMLRS
jgi:hypothetical protein